MGVRIVAHDEQFKRLLNKSVARGLKAVGVEFQKLCKVAVSKSNPHHHVAKFNARQQALRGGQKTGKIYESMANKYAGTPPFARTGHGRSSILFEFSGDDKNPAVRVGVSAAAKYMAFLEVGTRRIEARPWLLETLEKHRKHLEATFFAYATK